MSSTTDGSGHVTTKLRPGEHEVSGLRRGKFSHLPALSTPVARDLMVCALATIAIFTFVLVVEPFEDIHEISRHVEDLELDDIFLGLALSSFVSAWFSWRRTKDARREVARIGRRHDQARGRRAQTAGQPGRADDERLHDPLRN